MPRTSSTRIAFVLPALTAGGMEQVTLSIAHALLDRGYEIDLVLEHRRGEYLAHVREGVHLFGLERGGKSAAYAALLRARPAEAIVQCLRMLGPTNDYVPLRRLKSLARYLHTRRPAVVFAAHGRIPILALWARDIARVASRIVILEHSTLSRWLEVFHDRPKQHRQWRYRRDLARRMYPRADALAGVSHGVASDLADILGRPDVGVRTLYNPVRADHAIDALDQSADWFEPGEPPVVLAAGRLVREKGFDHLIEAFARLRGRRPCRLLILGEGEERSVLTRQVRALGLSDDVRLAGWVSDPRPYMARAGVFVLSSLFEGLGMVLVEAMASGCAVVSVDCPSGPREILSDGAYGPLVPPGDAEALAAAMNDALDAPMPADLLRERAAFFSVEQRADAYEQLIVELCSSTDGRA